MAIITRSATASPDAKTAMRTADITGLIAGETIGCGAPCTINSDGTIRNANGTAANAAAVIAGFAMRDAVAGEPLTLKGVGQRFSYGSGLTPGARLYLATTAGQLDTAATTGDAVGCAIVVTATDVQVTRVG